jgi:hypothetical protein
VPAVIITSNVPGDDEPPLPLGTRLVGAIDVECSKSYRVKGGNVPFCFSVTWLRLPIRRAGVISGTSPFWYTSAYVERPEELGTLITAADAALRSLALNADLIAGHQLCSDLAILTTAANGPAPAIHAAAATWRQRHQAAPDQPAVLDTRYDAGHILTCRSRRLADVCTSLHLDVTQPERSTCATAGQHVIDIPPNMTTTERVKWIAARVTKLGLTRDISRAS